MEFEWNAAYSQNARNASTVFFGADGFIGCVNEWQAFFPFLCGNRDTNFTRLRQGYGAAGESTRIDPPSVHYGVAGRGSPPPQILGNCGICVLVFSPPQ